MATCTKLHDKSENKVAQNEFILGIDIGTTTIKTALVNYNSEKTVAQQSIEHYAYIETDDRDEKCREQNVHKILLALNKCVKLLPEEALENVKEIVICGQMHGCVLWEKVSRELKYINMETTLHQIRTSSLITWEDRRCSVQFLSSLPKRSQMASGFGCASLFWLQHHSPDILKQYNGAGTIMDLVVTCLCSNNVVYISSQNAYSWGYFNTEHGQWELELLAQKHFPTSLLPVVKEPGYIAGQLSQGWCGISAGATVRVALGDMQCSILATMAEPGNAVLNIGTSTQLSIIVKEMKDVIVQEVLKNPALNIVPYFDNYNLIVAASLTGGNALASFVKMLQSWVSDLGLNEISSDVVYQKLSECGMNNEDDVKLNINPVLWGERHNPKQTAYVTDITQGSLSLGNVYRSLCHGLLVNVLSMMSTNFIEMCEIQRITGTGNTLIKNPTLQQSAKDLFNLPLVVCQDTDASVGAALSIINKS